MLKAAKLISSASKMSTPVLNPGLCDAIFPPLFTFVFTIQRSEIMMHVSLNEAEYLTHGLDGVEETQVEIFKTGFRMAWRSTLREIKCRVAS